MCIALGGSSAGLNPLKRWMSNFTNKSAASRIQLAAALERHAADMTPVGASAWLVSGGYMQLSGVGSQLNSALLAYLCNTRLNACSHRLAAHN